MTKKIRSSRSPKKRKSVAEKAVESFKEAQRDLNQFMEENEEFMNALRMLVDEHNAALTNAQNALKNELRKSENQRLQIGRLGVLKKRSEYWDGDILHKIFPPRVNKFFLIRRYDVDVKMLDQMMKEGEIDRDKAYEALVQREPTIAMVPGCPKALMI